MICRHNKPLARQRNYLYPIRKLAVATLLPLLREVTVIVHIHMICLGKLKMESLIFGDLVKVREL